MRAYEPTAELKVADPDRYLSLLYAPEDKRDNLVALYAFDAEIAALGQKVREPVAGEIRLQWWRDALAAPAGQFTGSPLADRLRLVIDELGLPLAAFHSLLEARVFDLYADPMPSIMDLEGYCGETASAMFQFAGLALDRAAAGSIADVAGHAGCARAMTAIAARVSSDRRRTRCFFPRDLLSAAGIEPEAFVAGHDEIAAARAVTSLAALARGHLTKFERHAASLPSSLRPAFLPMAIVPAWLRRLEQDPQAALSRQIRPPVLARHWLMLGRAVRGWPKR
ncbi:MAG: phytoene/squalene synthase family protein [Rhizobiaceae bacterium]